MWTGIIGPNSLPVGVTSIPGRPQWALGLLGEGPSTEGGAYHPSQSQIQLLASWHSGEGGCLETLGKQLAKPQLEWRIMAGSQVGRWAGRPAGCSGLGCALGPLLSTPGVEQIVPATAADFE